jgi:hypothetical protein
MPPTVAIAPAHAAPTAHPAAAIITPARVTPARVTSVTPAIITTATPPAVSAIATLGDLDAVFHGLCLFSLEFRQNAA